MKKKITSLFSVLTLLAGTTFTAQEKQVLPCGTYEAMEEVFTADPEARKRYVAAEAQLLSERNTISQKSAAPELTVPVVFHVLHQGGPENISDAAIEQALAWVNQDFDRTHSDVNTIQEPFRSLFIDSDIKFMLAHKDPMGNCTKGIVHYYDSRTMWKRAGQLYYNSPLYAGITWDPTSYLNIIIVKDIVAESGQSGTVVGYTFKPGTHGSGDTRDAVVYDYNYLNNFKNARSLSHEIGHWLSLSHTFGNTNNPGVTCGDDGICDTPPTTGQLGGCPPTSGSNFACAATASCGYSAGEWNVENIMDYTDCHKNFTAGQTQAMRNALASSVSSRADLGTPANLAATDVNGLGNCAPRADFTSVSESYTVCAGSSLQFREYAFNGTVTTINWSANQGAMVATPNASVTAIAFPALGTATVTLSVGNSLGSTVKTKTVLVVDGTATTTGPFVEGFELGEIPAAWAVENLNPATGTWKHTWNAAYQGVGSAYLEGATLGGSQVDILNTPKIDMQSSTEKDFTFAYAYARESNTSGSNFKVQASGDCGGSWLELINLSASQMAGASGGTQAAPFIPTQGQWVPINLATYPTSAGSWGSLKNSPHVTVRFVFTEGEEGSGNNFYLDAIEIPGEVGINELKKELALAIYPNPSNAQVNLKFTLSSFASVKVDVSDISGRQLLSVAENELGAGSHNFSFNENGTLAPGVYLVNIQIDGVKLTEKLVLH